MGWTRTSVVAARGATLNVERWGAGPAVVFLHGIGGRARQWRATVEALGQPAGALVWDARGYGDSRGPGVHAFSEFADDLIVVLDHFGIDRVLGIGHSMGGRILIEAAVRAPDRFGGLFLSGAPAAYLAHLSEPEKDAYVARRVGMFDGPVVTPEKARAVAREVLPSDAPDAVLDALAHDFCALRRDGYTAALRASLGWNRSAEVATLDMPIEMMTGALDTVCPPESIEALDDAISPEKLTILPDVAHMAQLEAPDIVAGLVADFIARNAARATTLSPGPNKAQPA